MACGGGAATRAAAAAADLPARGNFIERSTKHCAGSGGADLVEEVPDLSAQAFGLEGERIGGGFDALRGVPGIVRALGDPDDVLRDLLGAARCVLGVARDLLGRRALLLDRSCY